MTALEINTITQILSDILATLRRHDEKLTRYSKKLSEHDKKFVEIDKRFDILTEEMRQGFARQEALSLEILNIIGRQMQEFELKTTGAHDNHEKRIMKLERKLA